MAAAEAGGREDTCYGLADPERFVDSSSAGSFRLNSPPRCEATTCGTDQPWPAKVRVAARQRKGDRFSSGRHRRQDFGRAAFRLAKGLDRSPERQRVCATRHEPTRMNATVVIPCN